MKKSIETRPIKWDQPNETTQGQTRQDQTTPDHVLEHANITDVLLTRGLTKLKVITVEYIW